MATAGTAAASAAVVLIGDLARSSGSGHVDEAVGEWLPVALSHEISEGQVRAFDVGSLAGFVRRTNGQLGAVSGVCTHQGCRLALASSPVERLVCPCHGAQFAVDGRPVVCPRTCQRLLPLASLTVRERAGAIEVLMATS